MGFDSHIFWKALFSSAYLKGAWTALELAVLSMIFATIIGFCLALMRDGRNRFGRAFGGLYVWFFRAIPTLLIFLVIWNAGPQIWPSLKQSWFTPFMACLIGMSIVEAAYMAEILRAALNSVEAGQEQAARALGIKPMKVLFRIKVPQAVKIAIPPSGNEFIAVLKYTSLASVISLQELMTIAQVNVSNTFRYAEYYSAAAVYYLAIVSLLMVAQTFLERRYRWASSPRRSTMFALREARA